jgi:hypothetical protein
MINTIIKWIALVVTIGGALCTSLRVDPLNVYLLNAGAFLYFIWALRQRDFNIALVNFALLLIYVGGLFYHR